MIIYIYTHTHKHSFQYADTLCLYQMSQAHEQITARHEVATCQLVVCPLSAWPACVLSAYSKCKAVPERLVFNKRKTPGDFT